MRTMRTPWEVSELDHNYVRRSRFRRPSLGQKRPGPEKVRVTTEKHGDDDRAEGGGRGEFKKLEGGSFQDARHEKASNDRLQRGEEVSSTPGYESRLGTISGTKPLTSGQPPHPSFHHGEKKRRREDEKATGDMTSSIKRGQIHFRTHVKAR